MPTKVTSFSVQVRVSARKWGKRDLPGQAVNKHFAVILPDEVEDCHSVLHIPSGVRLVLGLDKEGATFLCKELDKLPLPWDRTDLVPSFLIKDGFEEFDDLNFFAEMMVKPSTQFIDSDHITPAAEVKAEWKKAHQNYTETRS